MRYSLAKAQALWHYVNYMQKLIDILGIWKIAETIGWMMFGEAFIKPTAHRALAEIRQWPTVLHYLEEHSGRYKHCHECALGTPTQVDSIT